MASKPGIISSNSISMDGSPQAYDDIAETIPEEKEEIHISLRKGNQVLSEFKFGDIAHLMKTPMPSLVFTLAHDMDWSREKLKEALTFYKELYLNMSKVINPKAGYSIERFLSDRIDDADMYEIRLILEVFKSDLQLNASFYDGDSLLMEAIRAIRRPENLEVVCKLINLGADLNHRNDRCNEALDVAVGYQEVEIVELLLERGARTRTCVFHNDELVSSYVPPLVECAELDHIEMAELLIRTGASMDPRRYDPLRTPLRSALVKKAMKVVQLYVKSGYNISLEEFIFPTELHPETWVPSVIKDNDNLRKSLETLAATPVSLKKQMRCFIWRYLSMKRVPIKRVLDLEIPSALISYLLYPSKDTAEIGIEISNIQ